MFPPVRIPRTSQANDVRLLAELSHEIRTPLTALLGYVELLLDPPWSVETSLDKTREMLRIVQQSGQHMLELVSTVLDWASLEASANTKRELVSPAALCHEALAWLTPRVPSSEIQLRCVVDPSTPGLVRCEPARLRQILLNVLGNALKFTIRGEVAVRLSGSEQAGSSWLKIEVSDTGVGMTPAQLATLFTPFAPGGHSASGAGVGLAISHRLCGALGGHLTAESKLDRGSTFRIQLPCGDVSGSPASVAAADKVPATARQNTPLDGCHVLLADDSPDTRRLVSLILRQAGAHVTEALHGLEACNIALGAELAFDVILLDLHMPLCDGLTAARRLRAAGYLAPIVALTAATHPEDAQRCLAAGCDDYATKPIDRKTLIETVRRWIVDESITTTVPLVTTLPLLNDNYCANAARTHQSPANYQSPIASLDHT